MTVGPIFCTIDPCNVELGDLGELVVHIANKHDGDGAIQIGLKGTVSRSRKFRLDLGPTPVGDHLLDKTIIALETMTAQADTHMKRAVRHAESTAELARKVGAAAREAISDAQEANDRVVLINKRLLEIRDASSQTRRVTAANAVTGEQSHDYIETEEIPLAPTPTATPARGRRRVSQADEPGRITVTPLGGPLSNEDLAAELAAGQLLSQ